MLKTLFKFALLCCVLSLIAVSVEKPPQGEIDQRVADAKKHWELAKDDKSYGQTSLDNLAAVKQQEIAFYIDWSTLTTGNLRLDDFGIDEEDFAHQEAQAYLEEATVLMWNWYLDVQSMDEKARTEGHLTRFKKVEDYVILFNRSEYAQYYWSRNSDSGQNMAELIEHKTHFMANLIEDSYIEFYKKYYQLLSKMQLNFAAKV